MGGFQRRNNPFRARQGSSGIQSFEIGNRKVFRSPFIPQEGVLRTDESIVQAGGDVQSVSLSGSSLEDVYLKFAKEMST